MRIAYCARVFLMFNNDLTATIDRCHLIKTKKGWVFYTLSIHLFTNRFWWHFKWEKKNIHSLYVKIARILPIHPTNHTHTNLWMNDGFEWLNQLQSTKLMYIFIYFQWKAESAFQFECCYTQLFWLICL